MDHHVKILVIDDEPRGVELMARVLRRLGQVRGVTSSVEAKSLIANEHFDAVVSDQRMPDVTGVELLTLVAETSPDTGRVLVTGYSDINATIDAINSAQVHAYISKPCPPEQMQFTVKSVIERMQLSRENQKLLRELSSRNSELEESAASLLNAQEAAESASRAKSEFLANMSHEIRTPMTSILGYTEQLISEVKEPERLESLETVRRNGTHLLAIINDILNLSQIEAGQLDLRLESFCPATLLAEVVDLLQRPAGAKGLELMGRTRKELPGAVTGDRVRIRQILTNLTENAIRYTDRGCVEVELGYESASLKINVIDTGIGISETNRTLIFEAFNQVDSSARRSKGGVGLGLTICRRLTELLGGSIRFDSEQGMGTRFQVLLPVELSTMANLYPGMAEDATPRRKIDPLQGLSVLLAEDSPDSQRLLHMFLSKEGASVEIAGNGQEAIDAVLARESTGSPFDLILMDMQMPEVDGYEATRMLIQKGVQTPIVALTAHAMAEHREECMAAGCSAYLTKPISRSDLVEAVLRYAGKPLFE